MSDPWLWQCDRSIPSEIGAGLGVQDEIHAELRRRGWSQHDLFAVRLALEEALINAIKHGNRCDPARQVRVIARLGPERLRLEITDEGGGFDPSILPDPTHADQVGAPSGRGVMLMRKFMSRVEYRPPGNCVVLEKDRQIA